MQTSDFDYNLPMEAIAQAPAEPRDISKLMAIKRKKNLFNLDRIKHRHFSQIADFLRAGDLLVWNNSKVFKARLFGALISRAGQELLDHKKRKIEIFLVRPMENHGVWKVLARPGRHVDYGTRISFAPDFYCDILCKEKEGTILAQFSDDAKTVREKANKYGMVPLPPYVKDATRELETYQTVYAKHEGSVAAPTAGFHFTPELIARLKNKGVEFAEVTLHVGLGTFLPIKSERVDDHVMHSEEIELTRENADKINKAKAEGRRVVAVGTTTARALEGIAAVKSNKELKAFSGDINIFIKPGFEFKIIDALITNFHLPKSTLLMLVCAFAGDRKFILKCYQQAIKKKYRFYSFGDAMIIS